MSDSRYDTFFSRVASVLLDNAFIVCCILATIAICVYLYKELMHVPH